MRRYLLMLFGVGVASLLTYQGRLSQLEFLWISSLFKNFFEEIESPPISTKNLGETERYRLRHKTARCWREKHDDDGRFGKIDQRHLNRKLYEGCRPHGLCPDSSVGRANGCLPDLIILYEKK